MTDSRIAGAARSWQLVNQEASEMNMVCSGFTPMTVPSLWSGPRPKTQKFIGEPAATKWHTPSRCSITMPTRLRQSGCEGNDNSRSGRWDDRGQRAQGGVFDAGLLAVPGLEALREIHAGKVTQPPIHYWSGRRLVALQHDERRNSVGRVTDSRIAIRHIDRSWPCRNHDRPQETSQEADDMAETQVHKAGPVHLKALEPLPTLGPSRPSGGVDRDRKALPQVVELGRRAAREANPELMSRLGN
jgi:hypothetical protein